MASSARENVNIKWERVSLIERFATVLYPFEPTELLRELPKLGYIVAERILFGARLESGKPIATKGNVELIINQDNKTLGVMGRDIESVLTEFMNLREFWMKQLDPSPNTRTHYVEIDCDAWAKAQRSPIEAFGGLWEGSARMQRLGKLLKCDVTTFGLDICPPNTDTNSPDWFEIWIHPVVASSNTRYHIKVIWRKQQLDDVLRILKDIDNTVKEVILEIERS